MCFGPWDERFIRILALIGPGTERRGTTCVCALLKGDGMEFVSWRVDFHCVYNATENSRGADQYSGDGRIDDASTDISFHLTTALVIQEELKPVA